MSLIQTNGRLRYVAPLMLIVALAACSKEDEAAKPAATPGAAAVPATPPPPAVSAQVQAMDADALRDAATKALRGKQVAAPLSLIGSPGTGSSPGLRKVTARFTSCQWSPSSCAASRIAFVFSVPS